VYVQRHPRLAHGEKTSRRQQRQAKPHTETWLRCAASQGR
jgi:hypothetical protein